MNPWKISAAKLLFFTPTAELGAKNTNLEYACFQQVISCDWQQTSIYHFYTNQYHNPYANFCNNTTYIGSLPSPKQVTMKDDNSCWRRYPLFNKHFKGETECSCYNRCSQVRVSSPVWDNFYNLHAVWSPILMRYSIVIVAGDYTQWQ